MEKHNLDKLFSDKLGEVQIEPQAASWDQIEASLSNKSRKLSWTWASIAASAIFAVMSSWYLLNSPNISKVAEYDYAEQDINISRLPVQVVYVPIYIHSLKPAEQVITTDRTNVIEKAEVQLALTDTRTSGDEIMTNSETEEIITEQATIIAMEEVPVNSEEEVFIASTVDKLDEKTENGQKSITIIYKQGEPAKESNFTKAISYMEDVRMGEKKLVNFEKLRENFRSKFKSSEEVDTE